MFRDGITLHLVCFILALLLFAIAGIAWAPDAPQPWPWRIRFIALGLMFYLLSLVITL